VLGLLELADFDGIGISTTFEISNATMDQLEKLANHIELAEIQVEEVNEHLHVQLRRGTYDRAIAFNKQGVKQGS